MLAKTLIERASAQYANKKAIIFKDREYTFQEVNQRANKLANALLDLGIDKTTRVAVLKPNQPEHIEITFALIKCGAVDVTINPRLKLEEIAYLINDSESEAVIMTEEYPEKILSIKKDLSSVKHFIAVGGAKYGMIDYEDFMSRSDPANPEVALQGDEICHISYTSGTTGRPKGILNTRDSSLAMTVNVMLDLVPHINRQDTFLALQPLYHGAGPLIIPAWVRGLTHVIVPDFTPETAFEAIMKHKVTLIKTVPTVLVRLLAAMDLGVHDMSTVHTIIYGGSPMPTDKLIQGIELLGPVFINNYGQAEAPMTITILGKEDHLDQKRLSSSGKPYTMVEVRVVDARGNDLPPGEAGEVIVRGDHMMTGFWKMPVETGEAIRDGWLYTRDVGRFDEEGYLYLVDRKSEMIVTGGLNVYPNEVEQVIYQHPAVLEAAVFGMPDPDWVEAVHAAVVLKEGYQVTEEELLDFCKSRLAGFKKPKEIGFYESLPKNAAQKIVRRMAKEQHLKSRINI